ASFTVTPGLRRPTTYAILRLKSGLVATSFGSRLKGNHASTHAQRNLGGITPTSILGTPLRVKLCPTTLGSLLKCSRQSLAPITKTGAAPGLTSSSVGKRPSSGCMPKSSNELALRKQPSNWYVLPPVEYTSGVAPKPPNSPLRSWKTWLCSR